MLFDLQLNTATSDWTMIRDQSRTAEAVGFQALWIWDHLSGATMRGGHTMSDCFTLLGAMAAVTTTIRIGPMVANVQNRHPAVLANAAATVQNISAGRLLLGLGSGGGPSSPFTAEHRSAGIALLPTLADRHRLLVQNLDTMDRIWAVDRDPSFDGFPKPDVVPQRIIGANSEPLARIAGELADGINVRGQAPEARQLLSVARAAAGTRPFMTTVWLPLDAEHLDPEHPLRVEFADVDRLQFVAFQPTDPAAIEAAATRLGLSTS